MPFFDFSVVEKVSVDVFKQKFLSMIVDHRKKVVIFSKKERSLEADDLRDHLAGFAKQLNKARQMIFPPNRNQSKLELLLPCLLEVVAKDHKMMLARKSIIEKRKEEQEQQRLEMQQETEKIAEEAAEQTHLAEQREKRLLCLSKRHINNKRLIGASNAMLKTSMRSSGSVVWLGNKEIYKEKIVNHRQVELNRLIIESEERKSKTLQSRKQERGRTRKPKYYLQLEEERLHKLHEEEEAPKLEEDERIKKEETEGLAKLNESYEKQR
ncbi:hypothetical protein P8452_03918 [Trifolium repens]|nr:hypothetical protein P8452_03918 [Trifolium repens]